MGFNDFVDATLNLPGDVLLRGPAHLLGLRHLVPDRGRYARQFSPGGALYFGDRTSEEATIEKAISGTKVVRAQPTEEGRVRYHIECESDVRPKLFALAKEMNLELWELTRESVSLEEVFRELTK